MTAMDLSDVVAELSTTSFIRKRRAAGTVADGFYTDGPETSLDFSGMVEPLPGRMREALSEGLRARDARLVTTTTELRAPDTDAGAGGDVVSFDGSDWDVASVEPWESHGGYYRAAIVRRAGS